MTISKNLKEKIIIIAENDEHLADEISSQLNKQGFSNIRIADDGSKVYEILRPFYNDIEQVGLVVVNEELPQCQVMEMCLAFNNDSSVIPFIILNPTKDYSSELEKSDLTSKGLLHYMPLPINYSEFFSIINFQLIIKHEYFLRHKQEERLINELAERKVIDAKMKYLVVHDELTNLLNRRNFEREVRLILNRNNQQQKNGALLFIDIDRFCLVNELEGFEVGDRLLVTVVSIIRKLIAKSDLFARIGSDEFCLFIKNKTADEVKKFAEKIRKAVYEYRFCTGDVCYSISISVGISGLSTATIVYHPNELISRARHACNMAKDNGRNLVWEYNEQDSSVRERRRDIYWVPLIKKALLNDSFFLVFQPIVNLFSGEVSHYEVLIRMRGDDNEVISPVEFIPVAERMGLIHSIDLWVVESAITFLAKLPTEKSNISLSINLSSVAFQDASLLPTIKEKLELTWVDAKRIAFEITETAAVGNFEKTRDMITKIRALGCKFSLDDFGAGFCSFNYLKTFPVDYVKIDAQFIRDLINNPTDQILVKSMTELVANLGKKTIAEYVDTPEAIEKLREIGVNLGQGYIFGKPEMHLLPNEYIVIPDLMQQKKAEQDVMNTIKMLT
ncbi:EAL domain-containing protein [methanotrophic endosymbiont of Bathymodiolus puteoserpentis (Logatchev)]|jgi:diguanylate cyclase (GGDEF)-like protein|uniref:EAL domain-containing protein n=1 Tax=methanotrophic endosymbiont of Bathymodiolus puteoserpentis (Logatchev) TaxID=343235 RepID=UPI0013CA4CB1|nr:EAL domain-containing protein [methanotrophic endosymbiont of Bathymodiolus puteoserpentis (Logatchev)]SHE20782.1 diguanylate cyclase/phosphodiesterase (GGDEF & EAL domains) with PAS/PAC sensor(s) [methanotrophic endosymbiont of Bathymodiolus puteoserpentis (Logatchev)]